MSRDGRGVFLGEALKIPPDANEPDSHSQNEDGLWRSQVISDPHLVVPDGMNIRTYGVVVYVY